MYQPQPSTSGYGRSSPSDNFATSSTGNDTIHHFSNLTHDGQIIRLPQPLVTVSNCTRILKYISLCVFGLNVIAIEKLAYKE